MNRTTVFAIATALALNAAASAQTHDVSWHTIDGGGATFSTGGIFTLGGTIGQADAGGMSGGIYTLAGGFWAGANSSEPCPGARGDANCDGAINFFDIDPFVMALFNLPAYQAGFCGGSICAADVDCSGAVDFFDIDPFVACVFAVCPTCP